jgi:DNA-binding transcriptional MerR regulator
MARPRHIRRSGALLDQRAELASGERKADGRDAGACRRQLECEAAPFKRHRAPIKERAPLATELEAVTARIERVLDLYSRGKLDETTLEQVSRRLRRRQDAIREQLATLEAPLEVDFTVNQERLRTFLTDMDRWMREGDVVRRKTLLREVYQELRIWPKTATKPWTRKVFVAANLDALTRFWMVSPTGFEPVLPD